MTEKATPETIQALTSASEMLMSALNKAKAGEPVDPAGIGKVIDALTAIKGKYPAPKSKTMNAVEFLAYTKEELQKAAKDDPTTRVARLAQLHRQMTDAEKQFGEGAASVTVNVIDGQPEGVTNPAPTATSLSPLAAQSGSVASQFAENIVKEIDSVVAKLAAKVDDKKAKDEAEKGKKPTPEEEAAATEKARKDKEEADKKAKDEAEKANEKSRCSKCGFEGVVKDGKCPKCGAVMKKIEKADEGWPRDMAPSPKTSEDPALRWGHEKTTVSRDWGKDPL